MRSRFLLPALIAVAVTWPTAARADVVIFNSPFSGAPLDLIDVTPFDGTLGTLDSVHVTINGVLVAEGLTPANGVVDPSAGFIPIPYQYRVDVTQDFDGLGATFFDFSTPATFLLSGAASGFASPFTLVSPFNYDFEFDSTTDLIGFDFPTVSGGIIPPLGGVIGTRNAFVDTGAIFNEIVLLHSATPVALNGPLPLVSSFGASGSLLIQYTYTPFAPVPEPALLTLVTGGVLTLALRRRRSTAPRRDRREPGTSTDVSR